MSRGDPGDIPGGGRINLVEALSVARDLPVEALDLAAVEPARVAPAILLVVGRAAAGETLSERDANLLFWGIHVLAEIGDTRLCGPLLGLLRRPDEELERLLGDILDATVAGVLIAVYDGDLPGYRTALFDPAASGLARWPLFEALAYLCAAGRVAHEPVAAVLRDYEAERPGGSSDEGWPGWELAVALLGLRELAPQVARARADGRLLEDVCLTPAEFDALVARAGAAPTDLARFAEAGLKPFGTAVDELGEVLAADEGEDAPSSMPELNPLRHVGRNDPCPCGSGRKYKKCCLAAA